MRGGCKSRNKVFVGEPSDGSTDIQQLPARNANHSGGELPRTRVAIPLRWSPAPGAAPSPSGFGGTTAFVLPRPVDSRPDPGPAAVGAGDVGRVGARIAAQVAVSCCPFVDGLDRISELTACTAMLSSRRRRRISDRLRTRGLRTSTKSATRMREISHRSRATSRRPNKTPGVNRRSRASASVL